MAILQRRPEGGSSRPNPANLSAVLPVSLTASRLTGQWFDAPERVVFLAADNKDKHNYYYCIAIIYMA
jgi:hypothetical protein